MNSRQIERLVAQSRRRLSALRKRVGRAVRGDSRLSDLFDDLASTIDAVSDAVHELSSENARLADARRSASQHATHYDDLFRRAPVAYVVTDELGVIHELNAAAERQFGRASSHLVGKPLVSLVAPADADRFLARLAALRGRGAPVEEQPLRFGADPGFDAEIRATVGRGAEAVEIRWILRDVTDRRRAERALRTSEARSRAALEMAFDGMLGTSADGRIVSSNAALREMFGYRAGELEGGPVDVIGLSHQELAAIASGAIREAVGVRSDGAQFPIEISARGTREGADAPILSAVRDLSVQKGLESRLRAANAATAMAEERERQRLAADLHDDVGQLLSLARIKLGMLSGASGDEATRLREEVADLVMRTHQHTESLMFQLSPPILRDMGLAPAIEWLAEDMGKSYGLRVHVEHEGEPALDEVGRATVFRSLRELLINAARHAGTKSVSVRLAREGDRLCAVVEDRGVGFDCGSRSSGFGLASVRERVESLGGRFELESEVGGGTRVSIHLALAPPQMKKI